MLEPDEFDFYDALQEYQDRFGQLPPTHQLPEKTALALIRKALQSGQPIQYPITDPGDSK